jgi:hypothetical protein
MNLDTSMVRELSRHRQYSGLPAIHQPSPELLAEMKMKMSDHILIKKRVHMPVDIAMINLWLKDYQGFAAFLKMSVSRNPVQTSKILVRHLIFGWYHDFIEGECVASIR